MPFIHCTRFQKDLLMIGGTSRARLKETKFLPHTQVCCMQRTDLWTKVWAKRLKDMAWVLVWVWWPHKGRKMSAGEIADCTCLLACLLASLFAGLLAGLFACLFAGLLAGLRPLCPRSFEKDHPLPGWLVRVSLWPGTVGEQAWTARLAAAAGPWWGRLNSNSVMSLLSCLRGWGV